MLAHDFDVLINVVK